MVASRGRMESTQRVYDYHTLFPRWYTARGLKPYSASVQQRREFLSDLAKLPDPGLCHMPPLLVIALLLVQYTQVLEWHTGPEIIGNALPYEGYLQL